MKIPNQIKTCVAFIGYENQTNGQFEPAGSVLFTGGYGDESGTISPVYSVTAKHVIDGLKSRGVQDTVIRMNAVEGAAHTLGMMRVNIDQWFSHPDDKSIDVSITVTGIPAEAEHRVLSRESYVTPEKLKEFEVDVGDEVFMTGLFRHRIGKGKNIPIIRVGNLAAVDEERIEIPGFGEMDAYLIEARSIGGLSGSPVFLNLGHSRTIAGQQKVWPAHDPAHFFLGIIHGHYDVEEEAVDATAEDAKKPDTAYINTGIAMVTPYYNVIKVINAFEAQFKKDADEA